MINKIKTNLSQTILYALIATSAIALVLAMSFFAAEPMIGHGQETFTITQTITDENSFKVVNDVTMDGSISGVTGGNATGTAQFVVISNNAAGYTVDIDFFDNGSGEAMEGDTTGTNEIRDYSTATMQPSYNFTPDTDAEFAYTVTSSTTADTDLSFSDNGAACNNAGGYNGNCWMAPSTTAYVIVDTNNAATTGATSTVTFRVHVPSGATPTPQAQTYTATATLSVTSK